VITTAVAIVVGLAGTLAVRAYLNAIDRGLFKRQMANMRSIATSLDAYRSEHQTYPATESLDVLAESLSPKYIKAFPSRDNWSHPFQYRSDGSSYTLYSVGKDGYGSNCTAGVTTKLEDETCVVDGKFVRYPEDQAASAIPR
jgi:type II secretory pathway pseudopilin PulG